MKYLVMMVATLLTASAFADVKYCGNLKSVSYTTDIFSVVRMGIQNKKNTPQYVTVKDVKAIVKGIQIVSENPNYTHASDMDDYIWSEYEAKLYDGKTDKYFVCVTGPELREYRGDFFLDVVISIEFWKNGEAVK